MRASLADLLSIWPARHEGLVLWARFGVEGPSVGARVGSHDQEPYPPEVTRELRRVRGDVPVVVERQDGSMVVVPWSRVRDD